MGPLCICCYALSFMNLLVHFVALPLLHSGMLLGLNSFSLRYECFFISGFLFLSANCSLCVSLFLSISFTV